MKRPFVDVTIKKLDFCYIYYIDETGTVVQPELCSAEIRCIPATDDILLSVYKTVPCGTASQPDRHVLDYLNGESFLGIDLQGDHNKRKKRKQPMPEPLEIDGDLFPWEDGEERTTDIVEVLSRLRPYLPTPEQDKTLRRFMDEMIMGEEKDEKLELVREMRPTFSEQVRLEVGTEGGGTIEEHHLFDTVYDLFMFECVEIYKTGQKVKRCQYDGCGRLYHPHNEHDSKYCSDRCRRMASENKSPEYAQFRKVYDTKRRYASRHKENTELQRRFARWNNAASHAVSLRENREISEEEFLTIMNEDIKKGDSDGE